MRIIEILYEGRIEPEKTLPDDIGGYVTITIDSNNPKGKFSMSYINSNIAKQYQVNNRVLAYDSHGHTGKSEPHIHILQKSKKSGYFPIPTEIQNFNFAEAYSWFIQMMYVLKKKYLKDIKK